MNIFILGVNGFIGSSLLEACLKRDNWHVTGIDLGEEKICSFLAHPRFYFERGDLCEKMEWVDRQISKADVVLPLAAIADPAIYVSDPLRVFQLDFEANLPLIRACVRHKKRLIFPSTSEVYGMCSDAVFNEETSSLTVGPIEKQRWIYSASKQLLDRVIFAHGEKDQLDYTLFRPFNWIGPRQDHLDLQKGARGRVLVQMLGNILRGLDIQLVDGGQQRRCFTDIEDGIRALLGMIENAEGKASQKIFNVGNPANDHSVESFARLLLEATHAHPLCPPQARAVRIQAISGEEHFGKSYQDIATRVPCIKNISQTLAWKPRITLRSSLEKIVDRHLNRLFA